MPHHVFSFVPVTRPQVEHPGIEWLAQGLPTCIGRQKGCASLIEHLVDQQLTDIGGTCKTEQGHHLRPGQQGLGLPYRLFHLVAIVHHIDADALPMDAALCVDVLEPDATAQYHLLPGAAQHPREGCRLADDDLLGTGQ